METFGRLQYLYDVLVRVRVRPDCRISPADHFFSHGYKYSRYVMEERLKSLGFVYVGSCNCNGSFNKKYKRAEYLIYITRSQFKVKKFGNTIKSYADIEGLEGYLQAALPFLFTGKQV